MFSLLYSFVVAHLDVISLAVSITSAVYVFWQSRVHLRLRVATKRPFTAWGLKSDQIILNWNIISLSSFDVYINSIGFCPTKSAFLNKNSHIIPDIFIKNLDSTVSFPLKISSHEAVLLSVDNEIQIDEARKYKYMFASTSCENFAIKKIPFFEF